MSARGRLQPGVPGAGGQGAGTAPAGIGDCGDTKRLRGDAGAGVGMSRTITPDILDLLLFSIRSPPCPEISQRDGLLLDLWHDNWAQTGMDRKSRAVDRFEALKDCGCRPKRRLVVEDSPGQRTDDLGYGRVRFGDLGSAYRDVVSRRRAQSSTVPVSIRRLASRLQPSGRPGRSASAARASRSSTSRYRRRATRVSGQSG